MVSSSSSFNKITTTGANTCFYFPQLHKPGSQMDTPSASSSSPSPSPSSSSVDSVTFYDFLDRMRNPASIDLVRSVKSFIVSFSFYTANPENDGKRVQEFFSMMEAAIKDHPLWAGATSQDIDSAMEGLEKYVMTKLFSRTFASTPEDVKIDQEISDKICLLQTFLRPEHLDIPAPLRNEASWLLAEKELQKINAFKAPREKLLCIMNFCRVINNLLLNASMSENIVLGGADDFLPVLIYVTIKANPPQLHSNLKFIQLYRRQTKLVSEAAYYFTNLVSAKTFIVDLNAKSLSIEEIKFEESMQAAKVANKAMRIEALSTSHERKASGEQRGPGPSRRMYHDETKTSDLYEIMRLEALHSSNDIKVLAEQIHPSPSGRIYGNETSTSGEYDYPYMEAKASELTVGDVEKLLSLYKDVVRKYKSLCHAVRHVSMTRAIPYKPHSGEKSVRLTQPAETSASVDCKRGN